MRTPERLRLLVALAAALGGAACASTSPPPGFLVSAHDEFTDAYGGWVEVRLAQADPPEIRGELIAVSGDTLYVLWSRAGETRLAAIGRRGIRSLRVQGYDPAAGPLAAWTVLGSLSTLSHGVLLGFTLPMWVIGGTLATQSQAHAADLDVPGDEWEELRRYARFPQGLPPGLDRGSLRPKW